MKHLVPPSFLNWFSSFFDRCFSTLFCKPFCKKRWLSPRVMLTVKCLLFVGLLQAEPVAIADVNFLLYLAEMEDVDGEMLDPMEMSQVELPENKHTSPTEVSEPANEDSTEVNSDEQ